MDLKKKDRVKHQKRPEWGLGEILDINTWSGCRIFFIHKGEVPIQNDFLHFLVKVEGKDASHPLLDNLRLPNTGKSSKFKSIGDIVSKFLQEYPMGFYDEKYLKDERHYKVEAHMLMNNLLNESSFKELLDLEEYHEICSNSQKVVNKTNLIFPNEKMELKDGLISIENERIFSTSLFNLLYGSITISERFEKFADCLDKINASKWTIQTYFLFLTFPDHYMFMKPQVTQSAADVFAFELHYRSEVNWRSYESLLKLSSYISEELSKLDDYLRPRDMIDVQSFIWCSGQ